MLYPQNMRRVSIPPVATWAQRNIEPPKPDDKNLTGAAALKVYEELVAQEAGASNQKGVWMQAHATVRRKYPEIAAAADAAEEEFTAP